MKFLKKLDRCIALVEDTVATASLAVIIVIVIAAVFFRYVLKSGLLWSDELVANLLVLMSMFAAARAVRTRGHTDLQMISDALPKIPRTVLRTFTNLLTLAFLVFFLVSSFQYSIDAGSLTTVILKLPLRLCYGVMPAGAALMVYEFIKLIPERIKEEPVPYGSDEMIQNLDGKEN